MKNTPPALNLCLLVFVATAFLFVPTHADAVPIKAKAISVKGKALLYKANRKRPQVVKKGSNFIEGDRIRTGRTGSVEILFDTGDIIRIAPGSNLQIKSLSKNKSGDTTSVFWLAFGRVKSAVLRKITSRSKFEYHTKSAICGIAGSPPFEVIVVGGMTKIVFFDYKDFGLTASGEESVLYVFSLGDNKKINLRSGEMVIVKDGKITEKRKMSPAEAQDYANKNNLESDLKSVLPDPDSFAKKFLGEDGKRGDGENLPEPNADPPPSPPPPPPENPAQTGLSPQ